MGSTSVTIRDVARRAAVSPSTVSLVLRDPASVHPRTRKQVERTIGELGYQRRAVGRPAKQEQGLNIAVVCPGSRRLLQPTEQTTATRRWFHAIQSELRTRGHHLNFFGAAEHGQDDPLFRDVFQQSALDGVVFLATDEQQGDFLWALEQKIPVVAINRRPRHGQFSAVEIDNYGAGKQAVAHLAEQGHRRIAMAASVRQATYNRDREKGYRAGMQAHGLEPLLLPPPATGSAEADPAAICRQALDQGATALFCDGDPLAIQCLDQLAAWGISVPQQFSVIGFDDRGFRSQAGLRPTSIGFDDRLVGQFTAEILRKLILRNGTLTSLTATVCTKLVPHDTVGPPATAPHLAAPVR